MRQIIYLLFIFLSFTTLSFFKIGLAEFTLFHAWTILTLLILVWLSYRKSQLVVAKSNLLLIFVTYLISINIYYINNIKITSFIYSVIILIELILLFNLIRQLSTERIKSIVKSIIFLYFINIFLTTICIILHIQLPEPLSYIFKIYDYADRIRPYGFADEPSYAALILIFSFFVLLKSDNFKYNRREFKWYLAVIFSVVLIRSTYGYMLLIFLLSYFLIKSHTIRIHFKEIIQSRLFSNTQIVLTFITLVSVIVFLIFRIDLENIYSLKRLSDIYAFTLKSGINIEKLVSKLEITDGSATMRIKPSIYLYEYFQKEDLKFILFGKGAGQATIFFTKIYNNRVTSLGFIPAFIYNYGIIGFLTGMTFFMSLFPKEKWILFLLFFLFLFNADFNTQIFLFVLTSIMFCKQIERNSEKLEIQTIHAKD